MWAGGQQAVARATVRVQLAWPDGPELQNGLAMTEGRHGLTSDCRNGLQAVATARLFKEWKSEKEDTRAGLDLPRFLDGRSRPALRTGTLGCHRSPVLRRPVPVAPSDT